MELYIEGLSESEVEELAASAHPLSYNICEAFFPWCKSLNRLTSLPFQAVREILMQ